MMNGHGKSDRLVVPGKSPNKVGPSAAEEMEGRSLAKGNEELLAKDLPRVCRNSVIRLHTYPR